MRFSVGIFDAIFGEKTQVEVAGPDGQPVRRWVTKKWLEQVEAEGRIQRLGADEVSVHMLGLSGYVTEVWKLGVDLEQADYEQFYDRDTSAIYAMRVMRGGAKETHVVAKATWMQLKRKLDAV